MVMNLDAKMEEFIKRWKIFHGDKHPPYPETLEMNRFKRAWNAFWDKTDDWKFIGYIEAIVEEKNRETGQKTKTTCFYNLYMTPEGKRMYEIFAQNEETRDWLSKNGSKTSACNAWVSGGKFPEDMVPENDVLASMLARLTADKLTGED